MLIPVALTLAVVAAVDPGPQAAPPENGRVPASSAIRMSAAEVFVMADRARELEDVQTAEAAYRALADDPNRDVRAEALFRYGVMLARAGRLGDAALLLRRLIDQRPEAAAARLELAGVLDRLGDREAAYREVRAAQASGLPPAVARLVDRYSDALRAARALGGGLEIAIAPDSNINRSTHSDRLGTIFGDFDIGQDSKAKSGLGLSLRGHAYRRLPGAGGANVVIRAGGSADIYRDHRFNDIAVDLSAGAEFQIARNRASLEFGATNRWFGQQPFVRSARVAAAWSRPIDPRTQVRLRASAALIDNRLNALQDAKSYSAQLSVERALSPVLGIAVTGYGDRLSARDPGYSTTGWRAGLLGWRDAGRATFTAGVEFGRLRADERLVLFPAKRSDEYRRLTLGATLRQFTVGGFAPITRLVIERNRSSIEFHDYRRTRTEIGITRAF